MKSNEFTSDPDVQTAHNDWYATSWEMNFGTHLDETATPEPMDTKKQTEIQEITEEQKDTTNDIILSSPDFSDLTTDVGDNPYS